MFESVVKLSLKLWRKHTEERPATQKWDKENDPGHDHHETCLELFLLFQLLDVLFPQNIPMFDIFSYKNTTLAKDLSSTFVILLIDIVYL